MIKNIILVVLFINYYVCAYGTAEMPSDLLENNTEATAILDPTVSRLTTLLNNINVMRANFTQVINNKNGVNLQEQSGVMQLKKPNLLRWQILTPDQMLIVTDGNKIWQYDVDLAQVIIKNFTQEITDTKISKLLLGDVSKMLINFNINILDNSDFLCFELINKNIQQDDSFVKAQLGFNEKQQLIMVKLYDQLDQETEFLFNDIKNSVDSNAFKFVMPQDVDVIED